MSQKSTLIHLRRRSRKRFASVIAFTRAHSFTIFRSKLGWRDNHGDRNCMIINEKNYKRTCVRYREEIGMPRGGDSAGENETAAE